MKQLWQLYKNELIKAFTTWRTYIGFGAVAIAVPLAMWGFSAGSSSMQRNLLRNFGDEFLTTGNLANGLWASHLLMFTLFVHIPFLITIVAGDVVAGEGTSGTFRIYLTRPISRMKLLTAKLLAAVTYGTGVVAFLAVLSLGLGIWWLGLGDVFLMDDEGILILSWDIALGRFAIAYLLAFYAMLTVTTLTFLFSVMVTNAIGPIVGTMAVLIVMGVLTVINLDAMAWIQGKLFITHLGIWQFAFYDPIPWDQVWESFRVLGIYIIAFTAPAYYLFAKKDILT